MNAAARALREGGRFLLCHRPDQLAEVLVHLARRPAEPKRRPLPGSGRAASPSFVVEAQKGRRPGLRLEPDLIIEAGAAHYGK